MGTARNGRHALEKVIALQPDVVTLDVAMAVMNGLEALKRIMQDAPRPVLMISALTQEGAETTFDALDCGAFDYIAKPASGSTSELSTMREEVVAKIKAAVETKRVAGSISDTILPRLRASLPASASARPARIIAVGASTGGAQSPAANFAHNPP